tara:strand:- start:570 stop:905 length:336 start_codon:yes stop_codon:yes gene_type:complete
MKKIISLLLVVFISTVVVAQNKNEYVIHGNLIKTTIYNQDGSLAQTGYYTKDNKPTGQWISYDLQGNKTAVATYKDGEKVGTWFFYQDDVLQEVSFVASRIAKVTTLKIEN